MATVRLGASKNRGTDSYSVTLGELYNRESPFRINIPERLNVFHICGYRNQIVRNALERFKRQRGPKIIFNHGTNEDPFKVCKTASDKVLTKEHLRRGGVHTQDWMLMTELKSENGNQYRNAKMRLNYPIVAKLRRGKGGEGMHLILNENELSNFKARLRNTEEGIDVMAKKYFFEEAVCMQFEGTKQEILEKHTRYTREYRVAVNTTASNPVITTLRKRSNGSSFGRNHGDGTGFYQLREDDTIFPFGLNTASGRTSPVMFRRNVLEATAIHAVESIGAQIAAVDIGFCSITGSYVIYEINLCPSMGDLDYENPEENLTINAWKSSLESYLNVVPV